METMNQAVSHIQDVLKAYGFDPGPSDGIPGPRTQAAWRALCASVAGPSSLPDDKTVHRGLASSFADPADVAAFRAAKARGASDQEAFRVGDNGVGLWGDDTTVDRPMVALPPEDWEPFGSAARGKKVLVSCNGNEVICELRDTLPHKAKIRNGVIVDLNPAACKALGLRPPVMVAAAWQWA